MTRDKRVLNTFAARVRKCALSLPQTYEDDPWGFPVFKVADNRLFAWMIADENALHVTMKLTLEERELARMLPFVRRASHLGRYGWITAAVTDDESLDAALEWIRESYWLRAPAQLKKAVESVETVDDEER
jgi:predicted DNA-binding protein (MmcQ/YjbR family)